MNIGTDIAYGTTGTFFVLSHMPALSDHDSFTFSKLADFSTDYHRKWNFYLYPGSTLNVSVCKQNSLSNFSYYLIRGEYNVDKWIANPTINIAKQNFTISAVCSSGQDSEENKFPTYKVQKEGDYYMVFHLHRTPEVKNNALRIDFSINRTKYTVDTDSVLSHCSMSYEKYDCTAEVPLSDNKGILALNTTKTDTDGKIDWTSIIYVDAVCNTRVWLYLLISLACLVFVVLLVGLLGCIAACIYFCVRHKKNKYSPLSGENLPTSEVEQSPTPT